MTPRQLFEKITENDDLGSIMAKGLITHTPLVVLYEPLPSEEQGLALFYESCHRVLQYLCAELAVGDPHLDNDMLQLATRTLAFIRQNLNQEFSVNLPEWPVVSMVDEMVMDGYFKIARNEGGEDLIVPEENPYDIKIRITSTPPGQAPEEVRSGWIGVELPARFIPGTVPVQGLVDGSLIFRTGGQFKVPYRVAIDELQQKDSSAAQWFLENLGDNYPALLFDADCAETIQVH